MTPDVIQTYAGEAAQARLLSARINAAKAERAPCHLAAMFLREQEARDYLGAVHCYAREERWRLEPADALKLAAEIAEGNLI